MSKYRNSFDNYPARTIKVWNTLNNLSRLIQFDLILWYISTISGRNELLLFSVIVLNVSQGTKVNYIFPNRTMELSKTTELWRRMIDDWYLVYSIVTFCQFFKGLMGVSKLTYNISSIKMSTTNSLPIPKSILVDTMYIEWDEKRWTWRRNFIFDT